mmetsp:Transcript_5269/g.15481  ORF Transcript_5269/g.15481 Transcript_5269/m.15481 type:complete len:232 (-) Transcript_5269:723-1418(-)
MFVKLATLPETAPRRDDLASSVAFSALSLAFCSDSQTVNSSPATGTPFKPRTLTGIDGPATSIFSPVADSMARIFPYTSPTDTGSPTFKVPAWTNKVEIEPLCLSNCASMTEPNANLFGLEESSLISDCKAIVSSKSSMPSPVFAEIGIIGVSPPHSSQVKPTLAISPRTNSISAAGLSILLMATIIGTSAACACATASSVCGLNPSSAATMMMAMSVTLAPLARMAENAS